MKVWLGFLGVYESLCFNQSFHCHDFSFFPPSHCAIYVLFFILIIDSVCFFIIIIIISTTFLSLLLVHIHLSLISFFVLCSFCCLWAACFLLSVVFNLSRFSQSSSTHPVWTLFSYTSHFFLALSGLCYKHYCKGKNRLNKSLKLSISYYNIWHLSHPVLLVLGV